MSSSPWYPHFLSSRVQENKVSSHGFTYRSQFSSLVVIECGTLSPLWPLAAVLARPFLGVTLETGEKVAHKIHFVSFLVLLTISPLLLRPHQTSVHKHLPTLQEDRNLYQETVHPGWGPLSAAPLSLTTAVTGMGPYGPYPQHLPTSCIPGS